MRKVDIREVIAKAICIGCDERPDHSGDASGNQFRWQDYLPIADGVLDALKAEGAHPKDIERLIDAAADAKAWRERGSSQLSAPCGPL